MLRERVVTAVIALFALLIALYLLPQPATRALLAGLMLVAAWEWSGFLSLPGAVARVVYVALIAALGACVLLYVPGSGYTDHFFTAAVGWWMLALLWLFFHPTPIPRLVGWVCGALVIVPAWFAIDRVFVADTRLLLVMLLIVWAADVGAYFTGRWFGRLKLAPGISPGKTWEGVLGGMVLVSLLAVIVAVQSGKRVVLIVPLCLAVACLSIVGDLTVSVFKRRAGVKDSGRLFPGHGGALDRIDSLAAAAPLFVIGSRWAGVL